MLRAYTTTLLSWRLPIQNRVLRSIKAETWIGAGSSEHREVAVVDEELQASCIPRRSPDEFFAFELIDHSVAGSGVTSKKRCMSISAGGRRLIFE